MSPKQIPPQSSFFYEGEINPEMDHTLIQSLVLQKNGNAWTSNDIPDEALQVARLTVNHYHGTRLTWDDMVSRKALLMDRFKTYKKVSNFKGAQRDPSGTMVHADDEIWKKMFKKMPLAKAYRYCGEPEFHNLCILFGALDIKEERSRNVIPISSTNPTISPSGRTIVLSDDEEVNSPELKLPRRRLFHPEADDVDQHSNKDVDPNDHFVEPSCESYFPKRNAFPVKFRETSGKLKGAASSSSCASSSPCKFDWGPFP